MGLVEDEVREMMNHRKLNRQDWLTIIKGFVQYCLKQDIAKGRRKSAEGRRFITGIWLFQPLNLS